MTDDLRIYIDEAMALAAEQLGKGRVADYIPALAQVEPNKLGFALALPDGTVHTSGDADEAFSIQSVSKVFTLALALRRVGSSLWDSVGREPSGSAFNSIVQLESEHGIPRNPLINAGAIATTDRLIDGRSVDAVAEEIVDFMRVVAQVAKAEGLSTGAGGSGFRAISNAGNDGVQEVPHFHLHILGGRVLGRLVEKA